MQKLFSNSKSLLNIYCRINFLTKYYKNLTAFADCKDMPKMSSLAGKKINSIRKKPFGSFDPNHLDPRKGYRKDGE